MINILSPVEFPAPRSLAAMGTLFGGMGIGNHFSIL